MKLKFLSIELKYRLSKIKLNKKLVVTSLIGMLVLGGSVTLKLYRIQGKI